MSKLMICLAALCGTAMLAQNPPPPGGGGRGGPPKNLKILKPEEVRATMGAFVQGTGIKCDGCHVDGDRASDEKPEKVTARKMLAMVRDINAKNFNGENEVTCFTCHRGDEHPKSAPDPK